MNNIAELLAKYSTPYDDRGSEKSKRIREIQTVIDRLEVDRDTLTPERKRVEKMISGGNVQENWHKLHCALEQLRVLAAEMNKTRMRQTNARFTTRHPDMLGGVLELLSTAIDVVHTQEAVAHRLMRELQRKYAKHQRADMELVDRLARARGWRAVLMSTPEHNAASLQLVGWWIGDHFGAMEGASDDQIIGVARRLVDRTLTEEEIESLLRGYRFARRGEFPADGLQGIPDGVEIDRGEVLNAIRLIKAGVFFRG